MCVCVHKHLKRSKLKQHQMKYERLIKKNGGVKLAGKNTFTEQTVWRAGVSF